jgi:hypothetical protein
MNERIRELFDQATVIKDGGDYVSGELDAIQFAELIVRECLSIADRRGAYEVMDDIIEHFGVES